MTNKKKITTYIIAGGIGIVAIFIALELIIMLNKPKTPISSQADIATTTDNNITQNTDNGQTSGDAPRSWSRQPTSRCWRSPRVRNH